jgi:hypothetical protein
MRVRSFELRLIAAGLTVLWTLVAGLVLLGYRPGGPIDLAVGLTATLPAALAAAALRWPPAARGDRTFALTVWLGLGVGLLLVPSIGGIIGQLVARGAQTLLPSLEAAYPWFLALAGTSLFASLGVVGRVLAPGAPRPARLVRSLALASFLTTVCGSIFAGAAIANELALRADESRPSPAALRWGARRWQYRPAEPGHDRRDRPAPDRLCPDQRHPLR